MIKQLEELSFSRWMLVGISLLALITVGLCTSAIAQDEEPAGHGAPGGMPGGMGGMGGMGGGMPGMGGMGGMGGMPGMM